MAHYSKLLTASLLIAGVTACNNRIDEHPLVESLPPIGQAGSLAPHLASTTDGRAVLSWLEPLANGHALRTAVLEGSAWSDPVTVTSGPNLLVNWADFPSVTPITKSLWSAHWLRRLPAGGYAYEVAISISNDAGRSWGDALVPHADGTDTEHGFVSLFPVKGAIGALWLDGRNTAPAGHDAEHGGGMTLRSAVIESDGSIGYPAVVDDFVCDCCQTDVAVGRQGPVAVYRDRTKDEIRDIHVSRLIDGSWQADQAVADDGWRINGCPVNGPAIAARDDAVAVAWFTAADNDSRVRMAWSDDDAGRFQDAIDVDIDRPVGRVDVELLDDDTAAVSWLRAASGEDAEICLQLVTRDGLLGPVHVVAATSVSRASGFPQMIRAGKKLVLAWTETATQGTRVATARIDTATLTGVALPR